MRRTLIAAAALGAGLMLAGCSEAAESTADPSDAIASETAAAEQPRSGNLIGPGATTVANPDHCLIQVDGRVWLDQPCPWDAAYGQIIVNVGGPNGQDFVYLDRVSPSQAAGNWSGGGGGSHAHDRLGDLTRNGNCWVNQRARICLPPEAQADFDRASQ